MNKIPLFPLQLVLFPSEAMPLHIFENRYVEMINECLDSGSPFGVVSYINSSVSKIGCLATIDEVSKRYEDGRFDIRCTGTDRFMILGFDTSKSYLQGSVTFLEDKEELDSDETSRLLKRLQRQFNHIVDLMGNKINTEKLGTPTNAFDFAHYVGFDLAQKQNMLEIRSESERLHFIQDQLDSVLPKLQAFEDVKNRIRANGHFREFPPIDFNIEPNDGE